MKTIKKFQYTKTIYLTVVCLLISATAVPSISSDEPLSRGTIYVDDDASPGWYNATHVRTIQEGINNATSGDTVYVYSGMYQENILINKTIILLGENKTNTFLDGGGNGNVINITADSTVISFLTIKNSKFITGILDYSINDTNKGFGIGIIIHSNNNTITNNTISNNQYYGIYIDTSMGNYIANNTIKDNGEGMRLWYASMSTIEGNNITSNYYGLLSKYGSNNTILNNTFYNNNNYGVALFSCQQAAIEQNMITNSIYGIRLCWSSHTNTVNGNYITSNSHRGIYFDSPVSNNTVFNNYFNNTDNANDSGMNNCWNISQTNGTNIIGGSYLGGNYWHDYNGYDTNGDGIGDINVPYAPGDYLPLVPTNYIPQPDFTIHPPNPSTIDTVYFTDNSTDPDGNTDIVNWTWDFGDGNISYNQNTTHSYADNIEYNVTLTIRDTQGAINNTQKTINISNVPPMVNFTYTPSSPNTNDIIAFNSTSFDIDGTIVNWTWDFNDGNISYGENTTHSFNEGSYNVVLYIIDDDGATNFTYKTINVTNIPPVVDFTYMPPNPTTADIIQFIDLSSDRNSRSIINWTWDFDDGNVSYNQNTTHSYADNGTYNVTLTIEDNDGAVNSTSKFVQVSNVPPVANFSFSPVNASTADVISFNDTSYDNDGAIVNWTWDFDDGNISYLQNPTHQYADDGTYFVSLTVEDDDGENDTLTKQIIISNLPPVANFSYSPVNASTADVISFNDTSYDNDGSIVNWTWDFDDGNVSYNQNTTHSYADNGTYFVSLTVKDDDGASNTTMIQINISNIGPTASFSYSPTSPLTKDTIQFTDESYDNDGNIVNWTWDFGDGNISYNQNPYHQYGDDGSYNVTLTVTDDDGATNSTWEIINVTNTAPYPNFGWTPSNPTTQDIIQFLDLSTDRSIVSWAWNFGDGNLSSLQHPQHQYAEDGVYNVTLFVSDDDGAVNSTSKFVTVSNVPPVANFSFSPVNASTADLITFNETSYDIDGSIVNWTWDFGDGNISYLQNPTYQYADDGIYTVNLTVTDNDNDIGWIEKQVTVTNVGPIANFSFNPTNPSTADTIHFTDLSYDSDGTIVSWEWDFGNGYGTTNQHPTYSYNDNGTYIVTLTVEDDDGANDSTTMQINVSNVQPSVSFNYLPASPTVIDLIYFFDLSSDSDGIIVNWTWDFGDGNISYLQNSTHSYGDNDNYNVTLTVTDDDGAGNSTTKQINVSNVSPLANFTYSPPSPTTVDIITFTDSSYDPDGFITNWTWDFDDGNISYLQNPTHQYADDGTYFVSLTVEDDDGENDTLTKQIIISNLPPVANFSYSPVNASTADVISFNDTSYDNDGSIVNWTWDFDDGNVSYNQNTTHSYADNGTYFVSLTVKDDDGASNTTMIQINISNIGPTASFSYSPTSPLTKDTIQFTDESYDNDGNIVNWTWDFGDGNISYNQNPYHQYGDDGSYNVTLTVTDDDGATNSTWEIINVTNTAPYPNFGWTPSNPTTQDIIQFLDLSTDRSIVSWAWNFGDGNLSSLQHPQHQYAEDGVYNVTLFVSDDDGAVNSTSKFVTVSNVPPVANFSFSPVNASTADLITFNETSYDIDGSIVNWTWDFGDGNISYLQNPTYQYADDGIYTVNLTVTDNDNDIGWIEKQVTVTNVGPIANFSFTPTNPSTADTIHFTDLSYDSDGTIVSWEWDFGNGYGTTNQHPTYSYNDNGTYIVTLTVEDDDGANDSTTMQINVSNVQPSVSFNYLPASPTVIDLIYFFDLSSDSDGIIVNWTWDFGDGNISYLQNSTHSYGDNDNYNVTLTVTDNDGACNSTTKQINVSNVSPLANFTYSPPSPTTVDIITFTDSSYDPDGFITNWTWDFDDGNISYLQNPTHNYSHNGTYNVNLTVKDDDGATNSYTQQINVTYPPVANFSFTPIIPTTGENISFIDLSYDLDGFITNWTWDFGDGNISYLQNPTHSYADNENYTVNLTIWDNDNASNSTLKNISVQNSPPVAHFNFTPYYPAPLQNISFTDSSYDLDGFITNWTWDFGDGNISYLQNPTHNYSHNGTYNVNLTVKDDDGATNSYTQQINVTYPPVANFSFTPIIPTTGENISFIDLSYDLDGFITNWTWDFGDGNNSYEQNPTHSYDDDGSYNVTLTVTDDDGASNSTTKQINVSNVSPIANFTYSPPSPTTVDIITFTDSSYDLDGIVVNWSWDFGDGNNSYLQNPTHLYTSAGNYTVCLIVTDDDNATNTTCKTVNVSSGVEVIDVNQSTFNRGFPIRHAIDGDWAGAQNFTPILNTLTSVDIYLRKFGTPEFDLVVELREDGPEGNLLDSVTFTPSEVSSSWGWLSVDFNDEAVTPGTDYFIVVPPAPSGVTTSFGYEWGYCFGDVYPDGAFWFTRDGGTLWRDLPTMYEFTFRTYGLM